MLLFLQFHKRLTIDVSCATHSSAISSGALSAMLYQALPNFGWRVVTLTSIAVGSMSNQPLTPVQPPDTAVPLAIIVGACVAGIVLLAVVGGLGALLGAVLAKTYNIF